MLYNVKCSFLMIRRPPRSTRKESSAASDVYKRQQLALNENDYKTKDQIVELLVNQPRLMERPVAIKGSKAIIARPSERIEELL